MNTRFMASTDTTSRMANRGADSARHPTRKGMSRV